MGNPSLASAFFNPRRVRLDADDVETSSREPVQERAPVHPISKFQTGVQQTRVIQKAKIGIEVTELGRGPRGNRAPTRTLKPFGP
jgi:hypothetical protein